MAQANRRLLEAAKTAIEDLFADTTVPLEAAMENMKELEDLVETKIDALQADIARMDAQ